MDKLSELIERLFQIAPYCVAALIMLAAAWYLLRLFRDHLSKTELKPADYLESFQKLHEEGELSHEEFRLVRMHISLHFTQKPDEPKSNFPLLNKTSPRSNG